jgi:uncharacterized protein with HEPN domain
MRSKLGDKVRLQHILDAIQEIESYIVDVEFDAFLQNSMMRFACIKQLEIIGEASNHVTVEVKAEFTEIEWGQIVGMRNVFVHEYFGVDANIVWEIIKGDMPLLKARIAEILQSLD